MKNFFGKEPQERIVSVLPVRVTSFLILQTIILYSLLITPPEQELTRLLLLMYAVGSTAYIAFVHRLQSRFFDNRRLAYINAIVTGVGIGFFTYLVPPAIHQTTHILIIIYPVSTAIVGGRRPAYLLAIILTIFHLQNPFVAQPSALTEIFTHFTAAIAALVIVETIQQSKTSSRLQVSRLEIINKVSKKMVSTLHVPTLMELLDHELKNILKADTYFIGIQRDEKLHMELFYDDGEYFNGVELDMEGTLSKWVIYNESSLFLPDLRETIRLEGVTISVAGKEKDSLSWMGVPMKGSHVNGLIAIASYEPNAFTRSDLELLSNIAQLVALALDNSYHHAQVEEHARLDSLTQVYNHGYFIHNLHNQAQTCMLQNQPLSLIMLDIDYFKHYNDTYGHLAGDEVLLNLCDIVRRHIKETDAVGRWGGEEFAISLPNSTGEQARQVALRIRESLSTFKLQLNGSDYLPTPTISMGIAVFPEETDNINTLIDLADKRLYTAKERGRDQIEAAP